jgi:hypothetical protein
MNLKMLGQHSTADAAVAWAVRQPLPLPTNQPRIFRDQVVLPGDEGYDQGNQDISAVDPMTFHQSALRRVTDSS